MRKVSSSYIVKDNHLECCPDAVEIAKRKLLHGLVSEMGFRGFLPMREDRVIDGKQLTITGYFLEKGELDITTSSLLEARDLLDDKPEVKEILGEVYRVLTEAPNEKDE